MRSRFLLILLAVALLIIPSRFVQAAPATKPAEPVVAVFTLHGPLNESPKDEGFPLFGPEEQSMKDVVANMKKAGGDANVKAVVLMGDSAWVGLGQIEELRQAIDDLKSHGKDVYAHGDSIPFPLYVLLSSSTRLSVVPTGDLWINGLFAESLHLKGLLDKIGVKPEFLTCGAYKSAAELFMREQPSPQADEMMNWLLDSIYDSALDHIAKGRKVDVAKVKGWVDQGLWTAEKAKEAGLVDAVESRDDFDAVLKEKYGENITYDRKYGQKKQPQMDFSSPFAIFQMFGEMFGGGAKKTPKKAAVGIVYVDGPIMLGRSEPSIFGSGGARSSDIRKALDQALRDDTIKAVVLRVDSPGGSATASEVILEATQRVKAKKPFVVSMGNVAGSGGYYVACGADTIFADDSTITGSIGVVSGKLVTTDMWKKIGVTFKPYARGEKAGMLGSYAPFTPGEKQKMQEFMDEIYGVFKQHVTDARGPRLKKPLDEIAGGRVYTGKQALELGLVDKIGSMQDAVAFIAKEAKLSDYDVRVVPDTKNFIEKLIEQTSGDDEERGFVRMGDARGLSLVSLARPYLSGLDAQRTRDVLGALERLQLLEQDRVLMVMPECPTPR